PEPARGDLLQRRGRLDLRHRRARGRRGRPRRDRHPRPRRRRHRARQLTPPGGHPPHPHPAPRPGRPARKPGGVRTRTVLPISYGAPYELGPALRVRRGYPAPATRGAAAVGRRPPRPGRHLPLTRAPPRRPASAPAATRPRPDRPHAASGGVRTRTVLPISYGAPYELGPALRVRGMGSGGLPSVGGPRWAWEVGASQGRTSRTQGLPGRAGSWSVTSKAAPISSATPGTSRADRKSTRLNSSHVKISYAV